MASTVDLVKNSNGDLCENKKTFLDMTIGEKAQYLREVVTVEPLLVAYLLGGLIAGPALQTLAFEKSCRANLKFNDTVCQAIRESKHQNYTVANTQISILLTNVQSWQVPCQTAAPLIIVLFIGSYSDRHRIRKPFMILPIIGELFAIVGCILSVIFMKEWSYEILGFLQTIVPSFFGGFTLLIMAAFSYIADSSTIEMRTLRVAVVQTVINIALPIGQFVSGILFIHLGYMEVLSISGCLFIFGIVYGIFCIKETKQPKETSDKKKLLADIFDPTNALDTLKVLFKKDTNKNLIFLWILMGMFFIVTGVENIYLSTLYTYLQNIFYWTSADFSFYNTANTVIHLIGMILFVPLFTKIFHLNDVTILIFTYLDKIATTVVIGLARSNVVLYIGCFVSIITNITLIALRSMATKTVSEDDLGKALSLFGICEAIGIAAMTPLFNTIFTKTRVNFPSAFIFCGSIAYGICFLLALFFYSKKVNHKEEPTGKTNNTEKVKMEDIQITHI